MAIFHPETHTTLSYFMPSHAMMCHFISDTTFDFLLTRSESNEDTKGLWIEELIDLNYAKLDIKLALSTLD